ncbi:hypothetical protein HNV10_12175 [Winogradskyella litoriviva]|uniref:ABC transporter permease n=1 Tax=Winogradskyella litoriviva TaxID=1220182 RepID=A0ABX2E7F6_9FLAO|nr:hypothetical protein [Winogradskyella litoriviva]NRD24007.1 hypothetical protein [Winogradskyella litoriviva]
MKKIIYKTNQYLIERYPTIWNTRLVWMLLCALLLHLLFFAVGFLSLTNPELLHEYNTKDIFFKNGAVYFTTMVSILLLVGWLIYMFKNNGFKNFYPTSSSKLFGQFISYILIIYSCSTFFLSYNYGIKTYISATYPDNQVNKEIEIANDVAMFFSESVSDYTIDKRNYPQLYFDLYCETTEDFIDRNLPYEKFLGVSYQFYSLKTKEIPTIDRHKYVSYEFSEDSTLLTPVFTKVKGDNTVLYLKDSVVDIKPYLNTTKPSYYNASSTFFISKNDTLNDSHFQNHMTNSFVYNEFDNNYYNNEQFSIRNFYRNKRNIEFLERKDKTEFNTLFEDFLKFSKNYKIPHNISAKKWTDLVYHPENFEVKHFIRTEPIDNFVFENTTISEERTKFAQFYFERITDYYYNNTALENVFENIEDIKESTPFLDSIHFFMWFAFFSASIIFMFRTTGLKPLLFSIITTGVLALIVALLGTFLSFVIIPNGDSIGYFIMYFLLILGAIIMLISIVYSEKLHKTIAGVCVNISVVGFPLYLLLITGLITTYQEDACRDRADYYESGYHCDTLFDWLGFNWSFVYFIAALVFLFFFTKSIKKWKSLPEG